MFCNSVITFTLYFLQVVSYFCTLTSIATRQATYVYRNIQERSINHCCRTKAVSVTYSECVSVVLVMQHTQSACTVLHGHQWPLRFYHFFPHCLINGTIFRGEKKVTAFFIFYFFIFLFSLQLLPETFLVIGRIQRDTIISVHGFSRKVPIIVFGY